MLLIWFQRMVAVGVGLYAFSLGVAGTLATISVWIYPEPLTTHKVVTVGVMACCSLVLFSLSVIGPLYILHD